MLAMLQIKPMQTRVHRQCSKVHTGIQRNQVQLILGHLNELLHLLVKLILNFRQLYKSHSGGCWRTFAHMLLTPML